MTFLIQTATSYPLLRTAFLTAIVFEFALPPVDYRFPDDYLLNSVCSKKGLFGICLSSDNPACIDGPIGNLPVFDFIIIGGGVAGSVLTHRLSEAYPNKLILLIEAGDDVYKEDPNSYVPGLYPFVQKKSNTLLYRGEKKTWNIQDGQGDTCSRTENVNESDRYGLGFKNGGLPCDAGKGFGGGSAINAMLWVCGNKRDYDRWENETGDSSWGYGTGFNKDGMLHYYKKATTLNSPSHTTCASGYGTNGPLTVSESNSTSPVIPLLKNAYEELNYPILSDYNCGKHIGLAELRVTVKNGERNSAARAYLSKTASKTNVRVIRNTMVDKILLSGTLGGTVTASGVRVKTKNSNCTEFNIYAKNEIILSAGSLGSPLILQRSGIGRKCDLTTNDFSIPQLIDSPVGANYQDHPFELIFLQYDPTPEEIIDTEPVNGLATLKLEALNYLAFRSGEFSFLRSTMYDAFFKVDGSIDPDGYPDVQHIYTQLSRKLSERDEVFGTGFELKDEIVARLNEVNDDKHLIVVYNTLLNPKSRGLVRIKSTNPDDLPQIIHNYWTDDADLNVSFGGISKLNELCGTQILNSRNCQIVDLNITECNPFQPNDPNYWTCYRKYMGQNEWHPVGTCKMGAADDDEAVVDTNLLVKGISGTVKVRVVDNSIIPIQVSGNTQCQAYGIGEKAADLIKSMNY